MKKTGLYLLVALFLVGVIYVVITLSAGRTSFFGRAVGEGVFSAAKSYIFASPLAVKVGGEKALITVFALDERGKGIAGQSVFVGCEDKTLCTTNGVSITPIESVTDGMGQATFDISATGPGKFRLSAMVDGSAITQTVAVTFSR